MKLENWSAAVLSGTAGGVANRAVCEVEIAVGKLRLDDVQALLSAVPELVAALEEARRWNNADIRGIEDITPNLDMLMARRKVINAALAKAKP